MNEEIYREKSLEKVKSPENLEDYIRVSNPSVWILIISIIVLLVGACVWGTVGHVDSTLDVNVRSEVGGLTAYVDDADVQDMRPGMIVKIKDFEATISKIERNGQIYICTLQTDKTLPEGFYDGKLVVERVSPLSFVFN